MPIYYVDSVWLTEPGHYRVTVHKDGECVAKHYPTREAYDEILAEIKEQYGRDGNIVKKM